MKRPEPNNLMTAVTAKQRGLRKVEREFPHVKHNGKNDSEEKLYRGEYLEKATQASYELRDVQAEETQKQGPLIQSCQPSRLDACEAGATRAKVNLLDRQTGAMPEVDQPAIGPGAVAARFKKRRINFALTYLVFLAAGVNNLRLFSATEHLNGVPVLLLIISLTLAVMALVFIAGRQTHGLLHGTRGDRALVVILGMVVAGVLFFYYSALTHVLAGGGSSLRVVFIKTFTDWPIFVSVDRWFLIGMVLSTVAYVLGLWHDSVEKMGQRARDKAIRNRIKLYIKAQTHHVGEPDRWYTRRNDHLVAIAQSIERKKRALDTFMAYLNRNQIDYECAIQEFRAVLAQCTGTRLGEQADIAPLYDAEPDTEIVKATIAADEKVLTQLTEQNETVYKVVCTRKQSIFECFEVEIKCLHAQYSNASGRAQSLHENGSAQRIVFNALCKTE